MGSLDEPIQQPTVDHWSEVHNQIKKNYDTALFGGIAFYIRRIERSDDE
jgi:hypothetical protein